LYYTNKLGFGDYEVSKNSLLGGPNDTELPSIVNSNSGVIIRHKEYLGDVFNTNVFTNTVFPINPGLQGTFPWLSQIANSFEEYEWRGLIFQYRSMSSDTLLSSGASTALGTVVMGTQYDVLDDPFSTKSQMENHVWSSSRKPSLSFLHPIECARGQNSVTRLYTRPGTPPTGGDPRLYDLGNFQIATQGMQNTNTGVIGELWCSYEIEFYKSQVQKPGANQLMDHFVLTGPFDGNLHILDTSAQIQGGSNIFCDVTGSKITFPATAPIGRYAVFIGHSTTADVADPFVPIPTGTLTNCTLVADQHATDQAGTPTTLFWASFCAAETNRAFDVMCYFEIDLLKVGAVINFNTNGSTLIDTDATGDLRIWLINSDVF